ncbi:unnamed protein product, partial [Trichogramma brassicae]
LVAILLLVPMSLCRNRSFSHEFGGHHRHFSSGSSGGATSNTTAVVQTPQEIRLARGTNKDVVSRNITMVLENLLMNYENSQLPTHGKGTPTIVKTNILIRSMGPISELDMDYSMDCYFRQYWRDSRLSFLGPIKSLSLSIKMLERIWRPDTYFYNGKHSYVHTITVPNKLLRISQEGDILYSMRLTIKAKCTMDLRNFPMDRQSCPLILGSYAYTSGELVYEWKDNSSVNFLPGMALSQFDLMGYPYRNLTFVRREGEFSVLQVSFNLQRHTGYFLIQVYVPCVLIVVLSWVSFWIHREATSDRVGLGKSLSLLLFFSSSICITTVLTLSTISLDSRKDLPKVKYATALDWFLLMSFGYCIATLLEFAGVHYFTKDQVYSLPDTRRTMTITVMNDESDVDAPGQAGAGSKPSTMERQTQTELWLPKWRQFFYCLVGDMAFRKRRQREAADGCRKHGERIERYINSVSYIDRVARIVFPASFTLLIVCYWMVYVTYQEEFKWHDPPMSAASHRRLENARSWSKQENLDDKLACSEEIELTCPRPLTTPVVAATKAAKPCLVDEDEENEANEVADRTGSLVRDVRRLKSATLERVGRILGKKSQQQDKNESGEPGDGAGAATSARKQKFNSLSRMLKPLSQQHTKDDSRSHQQQHRGNSLTRMLRRSKVPNEGDGPADKPDEHVRGIFSRMLGQIRGKVSRNSDSAQAKNKEILSKSELEPTALAELSLETARPLNSTAL